MERYNYNELNRLSMDTSSGCTRDPSAGTTLLKVAMVSLTNNRKRGYSYGKEGCELVADKSTYGR
jgi:hypothetical protein